VIVIQWSAVCFGNPPENIKIKGSCLETPVEARKKEKLERKADLIKSKPKPILTPSLTKILKGVTLSITDSIVKPTESPTIKAFTSTRAPETNFNITNLNIINLQSTTTTSTTSIPAIVVTPVPTTLEPITFTPEPNQAEMESYLEWEEKSTIENISPTSTSTVMPTTAPVTSKSTEKIATMGKTGLAKEASLTGSLPKSWFSKKRE
jgi:hypothetical protein